MQTPPVLGGPGGENGGVTRDDARSMPRAMSGPRGAGAARLRWLLPVLLARAAAGQLAIEEIPPPRPAPPTQSWCITSLLGGPDDRRPDALGEAAIWHLDFEPGGDVWLATSNGLYRYDGYDWEQFDSTNGLPSDYVRCVRRASDGRLWVGTDRGAGVFDGEGFDPAGAIEGLAGPSVRRIVEDPDGTLWFCSDRWPVQTVSCGLARLRGGVWTRWSEADGLPSGYVSDCFLDSRGRRFALTRRGLAQLVGERWTRPLEDAGLAGADGYFWDMAESPAAGVLAATSEAVFVLDENGWRRSPKHLPGGLVPKLLASADGEILTCSRGPSVRFLRWEREGFAAATEPAPGVHPSVEFLTEAPDGSVWAAGVGMLLRWERGGGEWTAYPELPEPAFRDRRGRVWFAGPDEVLRAEGGRWERLVGAAAPLRLAASGEVWSATAGGLASWGDEGAKEHSLERIGLGPPLSFELDGEDRIWVLGSGGDGRQAVACLDGERWRRLPLPLEGPQERVAEWGPHAGDGVWCILEDASRDLYRLIHRDRQSAREVLLVPELNRIARPGFLADHRGRLWTYGRSGLWLRRLEGAAEWEQVELPGRRVDNLVELGDEIWCSYMGTTGGFNGVSRLRDGEWIHLPCTVDELVQSSGEDGALFFAARDELVLFLREQGGRPSRSRLPVEGPARSAVRGPGGELWIGLRETCLLFRPDGVPPRTRARLDRSSVLAGEAAFLFAEGVESFRPRSRPTAFRFALERDGRWSRFAALPEGGLELLGLPVGRHAIAVRAQDPGGDVDPTPVQLELEVRPVPLRSRPWFLPALAGLLGLGLALTLTSLLARRRLSLHARTLEETVERRTAELRLSEGKYRGLFEQSRDAILLVDLGERVVDANPAACRLLACQPGQLMGLPAAQLLADPDGFEALRSGLQASGSVRDFASRLITRDGRNPYVQITANLRRSQADVRLGYQILLRDVTEQRRLEERLLQTQKMEAVGRFAGGIAHDFNNLLLVIQGFGEILCGRLGPDSPLQARAEAILEAAGRAQALTRQIQTFSRGQIIEPRTIDLSQVVCGLEDLLRRAIGEHIELVIDSSPERALVLADPGQLEQVILNLVFNARDAMPEGGRLDLATGVLELDEEAARELSLSGPGRFVVLRVDDQGRGMDEDTRSRIFEPFFTTKAEGRGTGLGLTTVSGIANCAGGAVRVQSSPGRGTRLEVLLPRAEGSAEEAPGADRRPGIAGGSETLLVVDDEPRIRHLLRDLLQGWGYTVLLAGDGEEAFEVARRRLRDIHLVLTDIVMPRRDGRDLAARLRGLRPELPVLFMSGYDEGAESAEPGAEDGILRKPFSTEILKARVREALDRGA